MQAIPNMKKIIWALLYSWLWDYGDCRPAHQKTWWGWGISNLVNNIPSFCLTCRCTALTNGAAEDDCLTCGHVKHMAPYFSIPSIPHHSPSSKQRSLILPASSWYFGINQQKAWGLKGQLCGPTNPFCVCVTLMNGTSKTELSATEAGLIPYLFLNTWAHLWFQLIPHYKDIFLCLW